jgi:hypothetical protein
MTQMKHHEATNNAPQWMAAFCYAESPLRWEKFFEQGKSWERPAQ